MGRSDDETAGRTLEGERRTAVVRMKARWRFRTFQKGGAFRSRDGGEFILKRRRLDEELPGQQLGADRTRGVAFIPGGRVEVNLSRPVPAGGSTMLVRTQEVDRGRELKEKRQEELGAPSRKGTALHSLHLLET